jgi:hypothetical protein
VAGLGRFFEIHIKQYKTNIFYLLFFLKMWDFKHLTGGNAKPENETRKISKSSKTMIFLDKDNIYYNIK